MGHEESRRALVPLDRVHEKGDVEGGDGLHPEDHVVGRDVIVHLQRGGFKRFGANQAAVGQMQLWLVEQFELVALRGQRQFGLQRQAGFELAPD